MNENPTQWWGDWPIASGELACLKLGPLSMTIRHTLRDWLIEYAQGTDPLQQDISVERPATEPLAIEQPKWLRFSFDSAPDRLSLWPALADRACSIRTDKPLVIPPQESVTVYVTSILRVKIRQAEQELAELPIFESSDTWFGSTTAGELCYAGKTWAKSELSEVPSWAFRALTPIRISNPVNAPLPFDALKLPVPNLSLYYGPSGRFYTEAIEFVREDLEDAAELRIDRAAALDPQESILIAPPRVPVSRRRRLKGLDWKLQR